MSEVRVAFTRGVEFDELVEHARDQGWRAETPSGYPVPATDPLEADAYVFSSGGSVSMESLDSWTTR
ncbi:hypothetical protein ACFV1F_03985 [Streptomyces sp. NPDC059590]|uniref:hypothetical protein n=1 Tax=Streptomyces sp. NPDC059590 TaxID=3346877 RepID=UPI0036BD40F4